MASLYAQFVKETVNWETLEDEDSFVTSGFSVFGLKHTIDIGSKSYLKTVISGSITSETFENDRYFYLETPTEFKLRWTEVDNSENRFTFSTLFNSKISKKFTFRTGLLLENYSLENTLFDRDRQDDNNGDDDILLQQFHLEQYREHWYLVNNF